VRARVEDAFLPLDPSGRTSRECWDGYARKLSWLTQHAERIDAVLTGWAELDEALDPILVTPRSLADGLVGSAVPLRFPELGAGYDRETVTWAVAHGHLMRDRFTVADLADLLGIWSAPDVAGLLDDLADEGLVT
jgi:glycerol-1-phosphate dehydrogenase [NAD(P)+]